MPQMKTALPWSQADRWARAYLDYLTATQRESGGWPHQPDQPAACEPTALALLALAAWGENDGQPCRRGLAWLLGRQNEEGAFSSAPGVAATPYHTAVALAALAAL